MECEGLLHVSDGGHDGVSGVVTACAACTDVGFRSQDIHEFALALVAPLRAEDYGHYFRLL